MSAASAEQATRIPIRDDESEASTREVEEVRAPTAPVQQEAPRSTADENVDVLRLKVQLAELQCVKAADERKAAELAIELERLRRDPASPAAATAIRTDPLAAIAKDAEFRQRERPCPWLLDCNFWQNQQAMGSVTMEDIKEDFIREAHSNPCTLGNDDVLLAQYFMFGDEKDRGFALHKLRHLSSEEQIKAHNWYVATKIGNDFINECGAMIAKYQWPLFPSDRAFLTLNKQYLRNHTKDQPTGGESARQPFRGSCWVPQRMAPQRKRRMPLSTPTGGDYYVNVMEHEGIHFVDLTEVQDAFRKLATDTEAANNKLRREFDAFRKKVAAAEASRADAGGRGASGRGRGSAFGKRGGKTRGGEFDDDEDGDDDVPVTVTSRAAADPKGF